MKRTTAFLVVLASSSLLALYACGGDGGNVTCTAASGCSDASSVPTTVVTEDGSVVIDGDDAATKNDASDAASSEWKPPVVATTSAACGTARTNSAGETFTTPSGRTFHVWAPSNYNPNTRYPVALVYHGWYTKGPAFQSWFKMNEQVGNDGITVFPDAAGDFWDLDGTSDLTFFDEMVKKLGETFCINPSRILGFGFSFGGKFMSTLGCKRAGYVKAISVGAGSSGGNAVGCGRLPVLMTHRTKDPDELIAWAYQNRDRWRSINGCSAQTTATNAGLNCMANQGCKTPGSLEFCEDTWFDPGWPADWNHTVREPYREYTWNWFKSLP